MRNLILSTYTKTSLFGFLLSMVISMTSCFQRDFNPKRNTNKSLKVKYTNHDLKRKSNSKTREIILMKEETLDSKDKIVIESTEKNTKTESRSKEENVIEYGAEIDTTEYTQILIDGSVEIDSTEFINQ